MDRRPRRRWDSGACRRPVGQLARPPRHLPAGRDDAGAGLTRLHLEAWGPEHAPRVVCLHGVTAAGGHFRRLAEDHLADRFRIIAPDLLGHGSSPYEPPWRIESHLDALLATVDDRPATWLGHSFGARLALELAVRRPELVERLVLLDPAVELPPHVGLFAAESARVERAYASFAEAIDRRYSESQLGNVTREVLERELRDHLVEGADGTWRYRYSQASVVTAFSELTTPAPSFAAARVPTLLVLGSDSYLSYDHLVGAHREALGDLLTIVSVTGGHTVLWDAPDETAAAVHAFLTSS